MRNIGPNRSKPDNTCAAVVQQLDRLRLAQQLMSGGMFLSMFAS
jgi:hypothetical protein